MPLVRNSNPEVDSTSTRMRCAFSSTRAPTKAENPSVAAQPAQLAARQSHRRSWLHPLKMLMGMLAKLNYAPKRLGAKPIVKSINPSLPRLRSPALMPPISLHERPDARPTSTAQTTVSHSSLSPVRTLTQTGAAHNKIRGNSVTPFTHQGPNVRLCSLKKVFVRLELCTWVG